MFNLEMTNTISLVTVKQDRDGGKDEVVYLEKDLPARVNLTQKTVKENDNQKVAIRSLQVNILKELDIRNGQIVEFERSLYKIENAEKTIDLDGDFLFWYFTCTKTNQKL